MGAGYIANLGPNSLIEAYNGAYIGGGGTVYNAGDIEFPEALTAGEDFGVLLGTGGTVINGATNANAALIYAWSGST